jgi:hypothetical protein
LRSPTRLNPFLMATPGEAPEPRAERGGKARSLSGGCVRRHDRGALEEEDPGDACRTGCRARAAVTPRLYEPFFTTKPQGMG